MLRRILQGNSLHFMHSIGENFPENTKVTSPQRGFTLWLELDKRIDASILYDNALRHGISIAPGKIFTLQNLFHNCLRLNWWRV